MKNGADSTPDTRGPGKKAGTPWYRHWLVKHAALALLAVCLTLYLMFSLLKVITRHNQELEVPDFSGMNMEQAREVARASFLRLEITDSVYITRMEPGAVYKQNPAAGGKVKKNRRILLTINATIPKTVNMPSLVGYSLRQAQAELTASQLKPGKLIYVEDIATNNVLGQSFRGRPVKPGTPVPSESEIDLTLGLNPENARTFIPDLTATPYPLVKEKLTDHSLNLGKAIFDRSVGTYSDSLEAVVYKQSPAAADTTVAMGIPVTVYLTKDKSLIPGK